MTWKTAGVLLARRFWVLLLCGVIVAVAAAAATRRQVPSFKMTQALEYHAYSLKVDPTSHAVLYVPSKGQRPTDNSIGNFLNLAAAQPVAPRFGMTGQELLDRLSAVITSGTQADVSYTASSKTKAAALLTAYAQSWKAARAANLASQIRSAEASVKAAIQALVKLSGPNPPPHSREAKNIADLRSELVKLTTLDRTSIATSDFGVVGSPFVTSSKQPISAALAAAGGFASGLFLAAMALLALGWSRGRIADARELRPLGLTVVELDSGYPVTVDALRAELEVAGIGTAGCTVALATSRRRDGHTSLPLELALAFAQAGLPTALIDANLASGGTPGQIGVANFLANQDAAPRLDSLAENLLFMPVGEIPAAGLVVTSQRTQQLLAAVSQHARVIVLETSPLLDDPSAILLANAAEAGVLQVNRRRSSADAVHMAALKLRRATAGTVFVAFDRAAAGKDHLTVAAAGKPRPAAVASAQAGIPSRT